MVEPFGSGTVQANVVSAPPGPEFGASGGELPDEVVIQGFPWRQTLCVRGTDHLDAPDGRRVYENRYVIWGRISWGKLRDYEVYEDTKATDALDRHLAELGKMPG